jgi:hypothetical protein
VLTLSLTTVLYIAASALFILSLSGLGRQETARSGNLYGIIGMALAIIAAAFGVTEIQRDLTVANVHGSGFGMLAAAIVPGAVIGAILAARVAMTSMPELVAMLHSFVGLAAVLVGLASHITPLKELTGADHTIHAVEIFVGVFVGALTFTGSIIAFLKLRGSDRRQAAAPPWPPPPQPGDGARLVSPRLPLPRRPRPEPHLAARDDRRRLPARRAHGHGDRRRRHARRRLDAQQLLRLGRLGRRLHARERPPHHHRRARRLLRRDPQLHHVPGDEPLDHQRDRFGGFGSDGGAPAAGGGQAISRREVRPRSAPTTPSSCSSEAKSVVIVPGYGMAVAQAQHTVSRSPSCLRKRGADVPLRDPPGRRPPARPHERPARRGQRALRHRPRDGRDQR